MSRIVAKLGDSFVIDDCMAHGVDRGEQEAHVQVFDGPHKSPGESVMAMWSFSL